MSVSSSPTGSSTRGRSAASRIGLLLLIALCVLFVSSYANRLARKAEVEQEIVEWEQRIADAQLHQQELQAELDYVNSPAYIEDVARNHLDMARPGDTVLIVVPGREPPDLGESTDGAAAAASEAAADGDQQSRMDDPTWRQWVDLLAGEEN